MIDPSNFTNFNLDEYGLQEHILFSLLVFNKNADQTAIKLDKFLDWCHADKITLDHFEAIRHKLKTHTAFELVDRFKFGNTTIKSSGLDKLVHSDLDLKTCPLESFHNIPGLHGMKTHRFFVLHTRKDARVACLDTHILKFLSYYTDEEVPKSTPARKKYLELEKMFLDIADALRVHPAILDLRIWNKQRGSEAKLLL